MGHWNETCFLSNLPILYSDKIKVFILRNSKEINPKPCYHTDNYTPICLPFDAEYDEYGGAENISISAHTEHLIKNLQLVNSDGTKYIYTDIAQFVEDVTENAVKINHTFEQKDLIAAYMHKDLYDKIITDCKSIIPQNISNKTLYECLVKKYDNIKAKIKDMYKLNEDSIEYQISSGDIRNELYGAYCLNRMYFPAQTLLYPQHIPETMLDNFITEFIDFIIFDTALASSRKGYLSISGTGSQSTSVRIQKLIAEFVLDNIKRKNSDGDNIYDDYVDYYWSN